MPVKTETQWELIVSDKELDDTAKLRGKENHEITVKNIEIAGYVRNGYSIKKQRKKTTIMTIPKKQGEAFEDEVWMIFYKMGFKYMNKNNKFSIVYSPDNQLSKQIDVVAIDDETCLLIECKESEKYGKSRNFQQDINEIPAFFQKVRSVICSKFPGVKCRCIFATKNYMVNMQDKKRMKENDIIYFDYSAILYYKALVEHLGKAAKYQLLGQIFAGQKISAMDMEIPAIKGKMGGLTYYSFVMSPESLLKIGYVLHKTNANNSYEELLPSYQRLIKKERLLSVRKFIDNGNFFPNSIIISIDSKNPLVFRPAPQYFNQNDLAKVGLLLLPQTYQSAYIIDGQHRLYGYSDSKYASTNSIPIVAFENLDKTRQLKLFMEINLNQKAVPKALRNILEIDVYYDSSDRKRAQEALLGKIAKILGEDPHSPLKERVVIGEDSGTKRCCITIESIKNALRKTCFFNKLKGNGQITSKGIFDSDNNPETFIKIYPIIVKYLSLIEKQFCEDWPMDDSFFVKNNIVAVYIQILSDIIGIAYKAAPSCILNMNTLFAKCEEHITLLLNVLNDLKAEERGQILSEKGAGAPTKIYRNIQMKMFERNHSFTNGDIENFYENNYKDYKDDVKPMIKLIKERLIEYLKEKFGNESDKWMRKVLSEQHENELTARINSKNNYNDRNGIEGSVCVWDVIDFNDFKKMITTGQNWSSYFKEYFAKFDLSYTKDFIVSLLDTISTSKSRINNGNKITVNDFSQIKALYEKMVGDE